MSDIAKNRVLQIYKYLEALCQHRNPVKRQISEQPWVLWLDNLVEHPSIECSKNLSAEERAQYLVKVRRPKITTAPEPPIRIRDWIKNGWQDPFKDIEIMNSQNISNEGKTLIQTFDGSQERVKALDSWRATRDAWVEAEKPARLALKIYEQIYDLYTLLQKESEKYRVVVGDGILNWRRPEGGIHHPILLQNIELEFKAEIPEFIFKEGDATPELYSALFASLENIDGSLLATCRQTIESKNCSPFDENVTATLLKRFVSNLDARGEYMEDDFVEGELDFPRIFRRPCIFLQDRSGSFLVSIKNIIEDIEKNNDLPASLKSIVGIEHTAINEISIDNCTPTYLDSEQVFFGKPANPEQIKIAEVLEKNWGILVQGPPGTGKTHTIANLLGHLLTNGKTVLVTSHTTKALRVLREKVAPELQSLCVSVLDHDSKSQEDLKHSIENIVSRLSSTNEALNARKSEELIQKRKKILENIRTAQKELIKARSSEFENIVIGRNEYSTKEAIKIVIAGRNINDWIPGQIEQGVSIPLSVEEIRTLYHITEVLTKEAFQGIFSELPSPDQLPNEQTFSQWVERENNLNSTNFEYGSEYWTACYWSDACHVQLTKLVEEILTLTKDIAEFPEWNWAIIYAGRKGSSYRQLWENLVRNSEKYVEKYTKFKVHTYTYQPNLSQITDFRKSITILNQLIQHLNDGGSLGVSIRFLHPSWFALLKSVSINDKMPDTLKEIEFLREYMCLHLEREELLSLWNNCMLECNGPVLSGTSNIEDVLPQICPTIIERLNWHKEKWEHIEESLKSFGFEWDRFISHQPIVSGPFGELTRLFQAASGPLLDCVFAFTNRHHLAEVKNYFLALKNNLEKYSILKGAEAPQAFLEAIRNRDVSLYSTTLDNLYRIIELNEMAQQRQLLLNKLALHAPCWAEKIKMFDIESADFPGDVELAWQWKQLFQELFGRSRISLDDIQERIETNKTELYSVSNQFIENNAWLHQKRRVKLNQQQALIGYLDVVKRIGKGTGTRVPAYIKESRRLMSECRSAVPVWIMPLARVAETFNPAQTKFDVVIIDEASQCDLMGLIPFYLAKQVVIVGDHEQVSPLAVGQKIGMIDSLISQYLQGIPNAILYDGKASVYDLARQSFGGILRLTEHFRCVPEIIQFSNKLCYNFELKPLRESNSSKLKPATINYKVEGACRNDKTNEQEAITIAALVVAACKINAYVGKSIGVISLLGDEQALLIERYLRNHLSDEEFTKRRIICGNSAHFQGDERDVIFLSMVDSTDSPPLSLRTDGADGMYKKRFNVATSRACDQMWVIHSLNIQTDVKPGDIRRELIEHAKNPLRHEAVVANLSQIVESPFEQDIMKRLVHKGYKVTPQWKVGHYRIDLVISYENQKVAVECDGDRYHTIDQLSDDMARQAVLERLGWRFIRIRGSAFYLNPEKTMESVFLRLGEFGVFPSTIDESTDHQDTELVDEVIRTAELLRKEWSEICTNQDVLNDIPLEWFKRWGPKKEKSNPVAQPTQTEIFSDISTPTIHPAVSIKQTMQKPANTNQISKPTISHPVLEKPILKADVSGQKTANEVANTPNNQPKDTLPDSKNGETDEQWVTKQGYRVWNILAKWGEGNGKLTPNECRFVRGISKLIINENEVSDYQAVKSKALLMNAIENGFKV